MVEQCETPSESFQAPCAFKTDYACLLLQESLSSSLPADQPATQTWSQPLHRQRYVVMVLGRHGRLPQVAPLRLPSLSFTTQAYWDTEDCS